MVRLVGIDLAGSPKRPTGISYVNLPCRTIRTRIAYTDYEIVKITVTPKPKIVAIDAPLTMPRNGYLREVDRLMHKLGLPVLPPMFPGMRMLTIRGVKLRNFLDEIGIHVIEVHPRSTLKILLKKFKLSDLEELINFLGFLIENGKRLTKDEQDAILAMITAFLYYKGNYREVRAPDGVLIIPR